MTPVGLSTRERRILLQRLKKERQKEEEEEGEMMSVLYYYSQHKDEGKRPSKALFIAPQSLIREAVAVGEGQSSEEGSDLALHH